MDLKQPATGTSFIFQRLGWEVDAKPSLATAAVPVIADTATPAAALPTIDIGLVAKPAKSDAGK